MPKHIAPVTPDHENYAMSFDVLYSHCHGFNNWEHRNVRCLMLREMECANDPEPIYSVFRCDTGEFLGCDDTKRDAVHQASYRLMAASRSAAEIATGRKIPQ